LAALPYRLAAFGPPVLVSLQELAAADGISVAEVAEQLTWLEDIGALQWDTATQTVHLTMPHGATAS
jgi:hypothetical protein